MGDVLFRRLLFLFLCVYAFTTTARSATILVLQFHNDSQYADLNWVGESIAETLLDELSEQGEIVLHRTARLEGMRRLSLRSDAGFTKATLIKLGQGLDADTICYGNYSVTLPAADTLLKDGSVQVSAHFIDLRKLHDGPQFSEAGKLVELSRLEEHLAFQVIKFLQPNNSLTLDDLLNSQKLIRVDAKESYIRGLMSASKEQQKKWFLQSASLDSRFKSPPFELGNLALERKEYKQALDWFVRLPSSDPRYYESRFKMGLAAYGAGDYTGAVNFFREVVKAVPLSEVYNDLGAAENQLSLPVAIDDFRRASDGDQNDSAYQFNLGAALLKNNYFEEAAKRMQAVLDENADDHDAETLLERAQKREGPPASSKGDPAERLKENFDFTAFRQLKAMLQPKGKQ